MAKETRGDEKKKPTFREQMKIANQKFKDDMQANNKQFKTSTGGIGKQAHTIQDDENIKDKKAWYKTWWVIVLALVFFPITLALSPFILIWWSLMKIKLYPQKKRTGSIIVISCATLFIVIITIALIASIGMPVLAEMKTPTNQKDITVSGNTSYKNSAIKVYRNGEVVDELKADDKGSFSASIELKEGENKVKVSATNDKSKTKTSPESIIVLDITPPSLEIDQPQSPTDSDKFTLKGKSEKNAQVILYSGDKELKKTKVEKDSFEVKDITLNEGENKFSVKATDQADNYSPAKDITVVYNKPISTETVKTLTLEEQAKKDAEDALAKQQADEAKAKQEAEDKARAEVEQAEQKLVDERKNFDSKKGNNAEAASTAGGLLTVMKDIGKVEGIDMYVKLDAPDNAENDYKNGGDLGEYRNKVISANLMVVIDSLTWAYTPESTQKDLVAGWVNSLRTLYPEANPHVTVNNGTRTVAEGSWSVWNGEASVNLK